MLSPRGARLLLAFLVVLKLAVTAYNAAAYDRTTYDWEMHADRARSGGLSLEGRAYNPPLYYLPTLPYIKLQAVRGKPAPSGSQLLEYLRWSNLAYLALFYWCWVFYIFPKVARDYRSATVASLALLALPSYQRLAASSHPDNALASLTAVCMALWLWLRWRHPPCAPENRRARRARVFAFLALALAAGLVGLTRPFGVIPSAVFLAALLVELKRGSRLFSVGFLVPAGALALTVVGCAGSWIGYQRFVAKHVAPVYKASYMARFEPLREGFDFKSYFTTFRFSELLAKPSRHMRELPTPEASASASPSAVPRPPASGASATQSTRAAASRKAAKAKAKAPRRPNPGAGSFFTLLYSEVWGDHWLYFSGRRQEDNKVWPKRILLLAALPLIPLLTIRFGHGVWRTLRQLRPRLGQGLEQLLALGLFLMGAAVYLYWQTGEGLLPGKNSTVKFLYFAYLVPFALAVCAVPKTGKLRFNLWLFYLLTLVIVAFPVSIYWSGVR